MGVPRGTRAGAATVRGRGGFSLLEVVVAMALFSIVLLGAGGVIGAVSGGTVYGRTRTTAAFLMQREVERLHQLPFDQVVDGSVDTTLVDGVDMRVEWDVTDLVPGRLAQVDVSVRRLPEGPGGAERSVRTFIANRTP